MVVSMIVPIVHVCLNIQHHTHKSHNRNWSAHRDMCVKPSGGALLNLQQSSPEEKDILLRVDSEKARDEWVKMLTKASLDYITTKKKMEREKREQRECLFY